jgi:hypothetical protein
MILILLSMFYDLQMRCTNSQSDLKSLVHRDGLERRGAVFLLTSFVFWSLDSPGLVRYDYQ